MHNMTAYKDILRKMLEVQDIHAGYGGSRVLHQVNFAVSAGEAVALVGRNGAGKTTTLRTIMGQLVPQQGAILVHGVAVQGWPSHRIARQGVGYVPEDRQIFADLSVHENLHIAARTPPAPQKICNKATVAPPALPVWTEERVLAAFPKLAGLLARQAGVLSGGEQQMLSIARALMTQPNLLLLDEPSEGLAPVIVDALASALQQLKQAGMALLLSEQNLSLVQRVVDRVVVLEKGKVVHTGALAAFMGNDDLQHQYLSV
jgi:branched-chain amino acid transport system ATP-binding protein